MLRMPWTEKNGIRKEKGFSASLSLPAPPHPSPHLLTAASDKQELILTHMDRRHGVEEKAQGVQNQIHRGCSNPAFFPRSHAKLAECLRTPSSLL